MLQKDFIKRNVTVKERYNQCVNSICFQISLLTMASIIWKKLSFTKTPEVTIIHKIFETNSSFSVKYHTAEKVYFFLSKSFLLVLTKFKFL